MTSAPAIKKIAPNRAKYVVRIHTQSRKLSTNNIEQGETMADGDLKPNSVNSTPVVQPAAILPFEEYEEKLTSELGQIHELAQHIFLFRSYELLKKVREMEAQQDAFKAEVPGIRKSISTHKKISTLIGRAIVAIDTAEGIAKEEDPELLKNLDVVHARDLLKGAAADLDWVRKELLIGFIHPSLRKDRAEKDRKAVRLPRHRKEVFAGFRPTAMDYWLIGKLDELLDMMPNQKDKNGRLGRGRIIKRVFQVGLSQTLDDQQIGNARRTMAQRRKQKMQTV